MTEELLKFRRSDQRVGSEWDEVIDRFGDGDNCTYIVEFKYDPSTGDNSFKNALPNTINVLWKTRPYKWNDPSQ